MKPPQDSLLFWQRQSADVRNIRLRHGQSSGATPPPTALTQDCRDHAHPLAEQKDCLWHIVWTLQQNIANVLPLEETYLYKKCSQNERKFYEMSNSSWYLKLKLEKRSDSNIFIMVNKSLSLALVDNTWLSLTAWFTYSEFSPTNIKISQLKYKDFNSI